MSVRILIFEMHHTNSLIHSILLTLVRNQVALAAVTNLYNYVLRKLGCYLISNSSCITANIFHQGPTRILARLVLTLVDYHHATLCVVPLLL